MNANNCFYIGHDHHICEDYSLTGMVEKIAYAIVCDGCSASVDVDVGARILAMSAKDTLMLSAECEVEEFGDITIQKAKQVSDLFPHLHSQALDATLLVAWVKDGKWRAYMYGDGVLVHKRKDGISAVHIQLTSGAPDYLSYTLDPLRRQAYENLKNNQKLISCFDNGKTLQFSGEPLLPYQWIGNNVEEGDVIALISDGINSFRWADSTSFTWQELLPEFTGYKTFEGEFVLRRIAAFKRKCLKEGITHSDDISVGAIIV